MKKKCEYGVRTLQFPAAGRDQDPPRSWSRPVWMVARRMVRSRGVATIRLYETKRSTPRACAGFAGGRHMMRSRVPELDKVKPNTPLRLDVAAAIVFPDGSMTGSGLRKEAGRGRLAIERIAGKDYTTLAAIERMRELCRQNPKVRDCGSEKQDGTKSAGSPMPQSGSYSMENIKRAQSAAAMIVAELKQRLRPISTASIPRRRKKRP